MANREQRSNKDKKKPKASKDKPKGQAASPFGDTANRSKPTPPIGKK